jgi:hypothetical protein
MTHFLTTGIIFGQTAFNIFSKISENIKEINDHYSQKQYLNITEINFEFNEIHIKLYSTDYNNVRNGCLNHLYKFKKISNCKLEAISKVNSKIFGPIKYFLYKDMPGTSIKYSQIELRINSILQKINIENIIDVEINEFLGPLLHLRKCQSINEALMNWALNNNFMAFQNYIDHKQLAEVNMITIDRVYLEDKIRWFLTDENIINFIPKKFFKRVQSIQKFKKNIIGLTIDFMTIISNINKYFIKLVRKYYTRERVIQITSYNLSFPIELYGNSEEIYHTSIRKSLYLFPKDKSYIHLKSFAILFNLRWFFNTRYNSKKSLGFDGEYGRTIHGYGQTFHKYDDVLLWLVTHPNTIEDVEFVVLDPIPPNYIFNF